MAKEKKESKSLVFPAWKRNLRTAQRAPRREYLIKEKYSKGKMFFRGRTPKILHDVKKPLSIGRF
jgi:hypothetical protein